MILRVEYIHGKNFVLRDVKPDNFLMGIGRNSNKVYVIDFGLAKKYRDSRTRVHIPYREDKNLTGTARYASINTHLGIEISRRDDMESLGYNLVYFICSNLPWQGLQAVTKRQKYAKISEKKMSTPVEVLCKGLPAEFAMYINYCRALRFEEAPDYMYLRQLFRILFRTLNHTYDYTFDWTLLKEKARQTALAADAKEKNDVAAAIPKASRLSWKSADVQRGLETGGAAASPTAKNTAMETDADVHGLASHKPKAGLGSRTPIHAGKPDVRGRSASNAARGVIGGVKERDAAAPTPGLKAGVLSESFMKPTDLRRQLETAASPTAKNKTDARFHKPKAAFGSRRPIHAGKSDARGRPASTQVAASGGGGGNGGDGGSNGGSDGNGGDCGGVKAAAPTPAPKAGVLSRSFMKPTDVRRQLKTGAFTTGNAALGADADVHGLTSRLENVTSLKVTQVASSVADGGKEKGDAAKATPKASALPGSLRIPVNVRRKLGTGVLTASSTAGNTAVGTDANADVHGLASRLEDVAQSHSSSFFGSGWQQMETGGGSPSSATTGDTALQTDATVYLATRVEDVTTRVVFSGAGSGEEKRGAAAAATLETGALLGSLKMPASVREGIETGGSAAFPTAETVRTNADVYGLASCLDSVTVTPPKAAQIASSGAGGGKKEGDATATQKAGAFSWRTSVDARGKLETGSSTSFATAGQTDIHAYGLVTRFKDETMTLPPKTTQIGLSGIVFSRADGDEKKDVTAVVTAVSKTGVLSGSSREPFNVRGGLGTLTAPVTAGNTTVQTAANDMTTRFETMPKVTKIVSSGENGDEKKGETAEAAFTPKTGMLSGSSKQPFNVREGLETEDSAASATSGNTNVHSLGTRLKDFTKATQIASSEVEAGEKKRDVAASATPKAMMLSGSSRNPVHVRGRIETGGSTAPTAGDTAIQIDATHAMTATVKSSMPEKSSRHEFKWNVAVEKNGERKPLFANNIHGNQVNYVGEIFAGKPKLALVLLWNNEAVNLINCTEPPELLVTLHTCASSDGDSADLSSPVDLPCKLPSQSAFVLRCSLFGCHLGSFCHRVSLHFDIGKIDLFLEIHVVDHQAAASPIEPYRPLKRLGLGRGRGRRSTNEGGTLVAPEPYWPLKRLGLGRGRGYRSINEHGTLVAPKAYPPLKRLGLGRGRRSTNEGGTLVAPEPYWPLKRLGLGRGRGYRTTNEHGTLVAPKAYPPLKRLGLGRGRGSTNKDETLAVPEKRPQFGEVQSLMQYDVPDSVRDCLTKRKDIFAITPVLAEPLSLNSYSQRFSALLYAEELEMERAIKQYAIPDAEMQQVNEYLKLVVPGLTKRRPSLLVGDKVRASPSGADKTALHYKGFIYKIQGESVLLKFSNLFHEQFLNEKYYMEFCFSRMILRRCHQAVEKMRQLGTQFLFPTAVDPKPPIAPVSLFVDLSAGLRPPDFLNNFLNTRQKDAVQRIVTARGRPAPYVVLGPPGTGKTVTLVEAILQIFYRIPFSRILVTAPSNSAADLLALRLRATRCFFPGDVARLSESSESSLPFCYSADDVETIAYCRIVVTTCVASGLFYSFGLKQDHFTHVFVDEASQATEPECLIPALCWAGHGGQFVLAGDPYQLGPVLMSKIANEHGLQLSLLERLTKHPAYLRNEEFSSVGGYNPCLVTKLIDNYRSHQSILEVPSKLFYDAELRPCAPISKIGSLCNWQALPCQPNFPIIFHGIKGEDLREGADPSWFNPAEAGQALNYALQLTGNGSDGPQLNLRSKDIGIITPYRKQIEKIESLLEPFGISDIKVGPVEEFQGQERKAIILSTVCSTSSFLSPNEHSCLGFAGNPKKFNVAITRAEALLIVIGNRQLLSKDSYWEDFIEFCEKHGACIGD
ncbi:uncharacterized protein [Oscarella lobularis]